jgi:hypothetical protein
VETGAGNGSVPSGESGRGEEAASIPARRRRRGARVVEWRGRRQHPRAAGEDDPQRLVPAFFGVSIFFSFRRGLTKERKKNQPRDILGGYAI